MKPLYLSISFLFLSLVSWSQPADTTTQIKLKDQLIGHWTYAGSTDLNCLTMSEMPHRSPFGDVDLVISKDSIWFIKYPCRSYSKKAYQLADGGIALGEFDDYPIVMPTKVDSSGLTLTVQGTCVEQSFVRVPYNLDTLKILEERGVNPSCLVGSYPLKTKYKTPDGWPAEEIPPINAQKVLKVNAALAEKIVANKRITLLANGKWRWFKVLGVSFNWVGSNRMAPYFVFVPEDWWKGEAFQIALFG